MKVKPTPLSSDVQRRFLKACYELPGQVKPAFHGTHAENLESIYSLGLVIPGQGNSFRVANGSTHGRGIYAATMDNPMLSWGFAQGATRPMLVCAVLDDAEALHESQRIGRFQVTAESSSVRHVGDAMVIFDPQRVAPLFCVTNMRSKQTQSIVTSRHINVSLPERPKRIQKLGQGAQSCLVPSNGTVAFLSRRAARKYGGY